MVGAAWVCFSLSINTGFILGFSREIEPIGWTDRENEREVEKGRERGIGGEEGREF